MPYQDRTGCPNKITTIRERFGICFDAMGGNEALLTFAQANPKLFYGMYARMAEKQIKVEDMNRTHEQFIELIQMEKQHMLDTKGEPLELVESIPEKQENEPKVT